MNWPLQKSSRTHIATTLLISLMVSNYSAANETQFPYVAYIVKEGAYVRSGPGQRHYPTAQLQQGYAVEVYRHDGSGWCAVRPPQDSFSWVAAHEVRVINGKVAEVISPNSVARVGSSISTDRSAVQVMLPKGEQVALATAYLNEDSHWIRIIAPAGEFRWIAAADLSRKPPVEITPPTITQQPIGQAQNKAFQHLIQVNAEIDSKSEAKGFRPPPLTKAVPTNTFNSVEVIAGSPAEMQLSKQQPSPAAMQSPPLFEQTRIESSDIDNAPTTPQVRIPNSLSPTIEKSENVIQLELLLSQTVAQPPTAWSLTPIQAEAQILLQNTSSPAERVHLRDLLSRIERFQTVQREYHKPKPPIFRPLDANQFAHSGKVIPIATQSSVEQEEMDQLSRVVTNVRERVQEDLRSSQSDENNVQSTYDAVGKLKPVISKREQAPPYALVDEKGNVVSFVTPSPNLNLQPYLGQTIGVQGNRGYMPEYKRAHITAGRVNAIQGTLLR